MSNKFLIFVRSLPLVSPEIALRKLPEKVRAASRQDEGQTDAKYGGGQGKEKYKHLKYK